MIFTLPVAVELRVTPITASLPIHTLFTSIIISETKVIGLLSLIILLVPDLNIAASSPFNLCAYNVLPII